ncbi:BCCT family transporter [Mongoliitalea daihaiensis]|uniref:BCCT family transporter n=1 Tax=Mongoliitalea daihaiensis TaxID=2782006 RepID=UPI001F3698C9|nr:BCCT family transporter [Mongoliitalea daihaiensis]UJP65773.1 BCCT family transporter [Mongoliitalea daihaiensis]
MILKALSQPQKVTKILIGSFCLAFLGFGFLFPESFKQNLGQLSAFLLQGFGFYYLVLGLFSVLLLLFLACTKIGNIRLGGETPDYNWFSWIAMLYSTGMGAGLLLRAVQEPVYYYQSPPRDSSLSKADFALEYTFFHWGLTPWAFYGLFGLIMAYIMFVKNQPALSSSLLAGKSQQSIIGVLMNVLTIICTLLGVVAALGLGGRQLLEAMGGLWGFSPAPLEAIYVVIVVCMLATVSALLGLKAGIRNISNLTIGLALVLMIFVAYSGWQKGVSFGFLTTLTTYLYEFVPMSLNLGGLQVKAEFMKDWTYFYWAFWLAWAPFTGVFIARISKGRKIRDFILAVLIIPSLGTFCWFTVFGQQAFYLLESGIADAGDFGSIYTAIFRFFDYLPFAALTKGISLFLVFTFLITSVDSAIFVLSMFSDAGKQEPLKKFRWTWGLLIGLFTIVLFLIGQESLLEAVSQLLIVCALPFSGMFLGMAFYFLRLLFWKDTKHE